MRRKERKDKKTHIYERGPYSERLKMGPQHLVLSHEANPDGGGCSSDLCCFIDVIIDSKVGGGIHIIYIYSLD